MSFLLFDEVYVQALIEAGAADAQRWLDFHVDAVEHQAAREQLAIDEERALRRR